MFVELFQYQLFRGQLWGKWQSGHEVRKRLRNGGRIVHGGVKRRQSPRFLNETHHVDNSHDGTLEEVDYDEESTPRSTHDEHTDDDDESDSRSQPSDQKGLYDEYIIPMIKRQKIVYDSSDEDSRKDDNQGVTKTKDINKREQWEQEIIDERFN